MTEGGPRGSTTREQLFQVLEAAEASRDLAVINDVQKTFGYDSAAIQGADWAELVTKESIRLAERLDFLRKHPRLPIALGGCALQVRPSNFNYVYEGSGNVRFLSDPILEVAAESAGHNMVGTQIEFGLTYYSFHSGSRTDKLANLVVYNTVVEQESNTRERKELYRLEASRTQDRIFYKVKGKSFANYAANMRYHTKEAYRQENPWVDNYMIFDDDGMWAVVYEGNRSGHVSPNDGKDRIFGELIPQYSPGEHWQYPAELYHYPLGLLIHANRQFGSKRK